MARTLTGLDLDVDGCLPPPLVLDEDAYRSRRRQPGRTLLWIQPFEHIRTYDIGPVVVSALKAAFAVLGQ